MMYRTMMATLAITLGVASWAQAAETTKNTGKTYELLNLFGEVFERIRSDYVENPEDQDLIENAINGMLSALDPHSSYLNAKSFRDTQVQTRGEFGGLGIEVTQESGIIKVVSPIDDTPAHRAGIEPGDLITHLNRQPVVGMTLSEAVEMMRGPPGTDIVISLRRAGREPFDVTLTRAVIRIRSVRASLEGEIGYVRITQFNSQTDQNLRKSVDDFYKQTGAKLRGVILDLRNNPGGLLDQAVAVSDSFLEKGEIVSTRSRRTEETQRFNAKPGDIIKGLPLVILINGGSASASEIVAGALQDHRRAIVLGTKSFGKGSVQTIMPLPGHGAMRLTTARYYTPSGRSIQAVGIEPDIEVKQARLQTVDEPARRREADLKGALDTSTRPATPATPPAAKPAEPAAPPMTDDEDSPAAATMSPQQDYQLSRAIDLLRGLALFSGRS
ncbi:MAG: S41 family peptidase [Rhodospirillales bacterium]|nr:S41 family peptidase [Rhodospirillales bacterium]